MDFIYFADTPAQDLEGLPGDYPFTCDISTVLEHSGPLDFILVGKALDEKIIALCEQIRQHARWSLLPIFHYLDLGSYLTEIMDAKVDSFEKACELAHDIQQIIQTLPPILADDKDSNLLRLLLTRQHKSIKPIQDWQSPSLFRYPLLETLDPSIQTWVWLKSLQERKLIVSTQLIDRIRLCPHCDTGHLNYIDTCTNCHSIHIEQADFYHCFTCGYVGLQTEFIHGQQMSCPRCHTVLRHIGSDYDRPIEDYHCHDCGQNFLEPDVVAECLQCHEKNPTESLSVISIHEYTLTKLATMSVMNNTVVDVYALLDHLNFITPQYFEYWLNWYLQMAARYKTHHFALMLIHIDQVEALTQHFGFGFTHQLIEGVAERMRELIRTTDLSTRTSTNLLWLLLPETPADGCEILVKRLRAISDATKQEDGSQIAFQIGYLLSSELDLNHEQAKTLMHQLEGKITS